MILNKKKEFLGYDIKLYPVEIALDSVKSSLYCLFSKPYSELEL